MKAGVLERFENITHSKETINTKAGLHPFL
jgi:hypothetical protein